MKKVLIISSTLVKGGNSELLCQAFAQGATEAGHQVETVNLREKKINFCRGCEACVKVGKGCVQKDDIPAVGTSVTFLIFAGVLMLLALIYFFSQNRNRIKAVAAIMVFLFLSHTKKVITL